MMKRFTVCAMAVLLGLSAVAQSVAPAFALPDINGATHSLSHYIGKIVVLEWTNYDCPFVRKFYETGTMQAMQEEYTAKNVVWLSICSSAPGKQGNLSLDEWKLRVKANGSKATAVLLDESGRVGHAYRASNTPHIFVVDKDGNLAYQGSVDDQRTADPKTAGKGRNYLDEALYALLAGNPVPTPMTKPYGCSVKY
ncbi:thioredoxin family protein [Tichowtungia aerotolerans]|uniref:Redoxin domain-containing protein n=1 Tax=Tichowtungia aerotolerans TaxID=2697043 RepID=A0A6P1LZH5_9BACT|nr:thioredoxin family protein [Tichowtungia aerotolerans]QHI67939.1 redoxin domain-containing protein [Tichowtungia aerotolerans]